MGTTIQQSLFALDCGATNWRLYRTSYQYTGGIATQVGEPQISPLTSFAERKLPAALMLSQDGKSVEAIGEVAQNYLDDEKLRIQIREYFKPCIGSHLIENPLPHQTRFGHEESLDLTRLMLDAVVEQIRMEKWRAGQFDERILFSFAFPVHWRMDHNGVIFNDYREIVLSCFDADMHEQVRFVPEPEGAILNLQRQGLISGKDDEAITMIFDVGGSTTDIVAGKINPKTKGLDYVGRYGAPFGGGLYDAALGEYLAEALDIPSDILSEQPAVITTLRVFAQRLKETLSRQKLHPGNMARPPQRTISMVLDSGEVYRRVIELSEGLFNERTSELQRDFNALVDQALEKIGMDAKDLTQIVLVGGGSQLFTQVRHLRARFGEEKVILADNPDEIVVQGIGLEYGKTFEDYQPTIIFTTELLNEMGISPPGPEKDTLTWLLASDSERFTLEGEGIKKVGRDKSNHIHINREKLSRFHAEIKIQGEEIHLIDLDSTNGTFLNGEKLKPRQKHLLQAGDKIRFGDIEYVCSLDQPVNERGSP